MSILSPCAKNTTWQKHTYWFKGTACLKDSVLKDLLWKQHSVHTKLIHMWNFVGLGFWVIWDVNSLDTFCSFQHPLQIAVFSQRQTVLIFWKEGFVFFRQGFCSLGCPWTCSVDQPVFQLPEISLPLGLKTCATTTQLGRDLNTRSCNRASWAWDLQPTCRWQWTPFLAAITIK